MNWKTNIQVRDLEATDRLELTCKKCGTVRYITGAELQSRKGAGRLWLDEVEKRSRCRVFGCGGTMRMARPPEGDTTAFVGGIA